MNLPKYERGDWKYLLAMTVGLLLACGVESIVEYILT